MVKDSLKASFANDINLLRTRGAPADRRARRRPGDHAHDGVARARPSEFVDGVRITGREDVKVVEMVLTGQINTELVSLLNQSSAHAVGVSGKDAGLLRARKLVGEGGRDLGMVGEITHVEPRASRGAARQEVRAGRVARGPRRGRRGLQHQRRRGGRRDRDRAQGREAHLPDRRRGHPRERASS